MEARVSARLSVSEGRQFGLTVGAALLALGALLLLWRHKPIAGTIVGGLGALLLLAGLALPTRLGPIQRGWMAFAGMISRVTTPIFMGVVFFLVLTPIGLLMRLLGHQPLVHPSRDGGFWLPPASGGRSDIQRQF